MRDEGAVVFGGSRGIGRAIALALAARGAKVAVHYHSSREAAEETVARIKDQGGMAMAVQADLGAGSLPEGFVASIEAELGPMRHLVYSAGRANVDSALHLDLADWDEVHAVNLRGAVVACQAFVPGMARRRSGSVVLVSSESGRFGSPGLSAYTASKAGLNAYAQSLAFEVGSRGVRVNVVSPGPVETDMIDDMDEEQRLAITSRIALGRFAQPEEVAETACFLLSDAARYITGAVLPVNGGLRTF